MNAWEFLDLIRLRGGTVEVINGRPVIVGHVHPWLHAWLAAYPREILFALANPDKRPVKPERKPRNPLRRKARRDFGR
jgi:hypothetical protein